MTISATAQGLKPGVVTSSNRPANPFDGMVIYETDTDKALVWNGSAWVYLSTGTATPPVTASPGMVWLTGSSFTNASTVSAPANTMTSTYRAYKVIFETTSVSTSNVEILFRYRANGSDLTGNIYRQIGIGLTSGGAGGNTSGDRTNFYLGTTESTADLFYASLDLHGTPYSQHKGLQGFVSYNDASAHRGQALICQTNGTTSADSFTFYTSTGTITGYYNVYGYAVS